MNAVDERRAFSSDSAVFPLPRLGWRKLRAHAGLAAVLGLTGVLSVAAGLAGALQRIGQFQRLDFATVPTPAGFLIVAVEPRSGAARAGLSWGDSIRSVDGVVPSNPAQLERLLFSKRVVVLDVEQRGLVRQVAYYTPAPTIDLRYLTVAFAAMFTLAVATMVFIGQPSAHSGRFLALAQALFVAVVIPAPLPRESVGQLLLLARDLGRLALPPLLVVFFATFPQVSAGPTFRLLAFAPSVVVGAGRTALAAGWLPPVVGNVLLPETLDIATVVLVMAGIAVAAVLGVRAYLRSRDDPTKRRQVEWVALGAAAGFTPYLVLSLIPQLAGAEFQVLSWLSLLPLALVPLGVASSLLEFRLWDLEDITRQVIATGLSVLVGSISFALLAYALTELGFHLGNLRNLVAVAGGVALAALTVPLRRLLLNSLERFQYRERLAARRALTTFAEEVASHRDPEELLARLRQLVRDALGVEQVVTYLEQHGRLHPLPAEEPYPPLLAEEISGPFPTAAERPLLAAGLWHRFPLARDGRIVGILYCSRRRGQLPLGHGERRLVSALTAQAALALQNTLLLHDLRRQLEEHRLLEDYLERVFQSSAAALLICDASGQVLRANRKAAELLGKREDTLVGQTLPQLVQGPEEWRTSLPANVSGVPVRFPAGGTLRSGLVSIAALETEPGCFDGRVVALDDISEQLTLEQRLAQQEHFAALGRLAAGLAHEINTPVTGIASYAQLLRDLTAPGDPRLPLLEKLEEQAFRVSRIVTNLMELARPAGFERRRCDLAEIVVGEVKRMVPEATRQGVRLASRVDGPALLDGNGVQLELVTHNLLRNALQATPRGGSVEAAVRHEGGALHLTVSDTGEGVPEELRDAIFEPFVTSRQGRGGTGLGLAITRDIVRAHGGAIAVKANEPRGTVVEVVFPPSGGQHAHLDH
jgi:two-component system NtrC family sensor kinase